MEYQAGSKVLDGWEIMELIGEGSYGRVYKVRKSSYGVETISALKVIRIPESPSEVRSALSDGMDERSVTGYFKGFVEEILHEIAIMSTVKSHPNIVSYEDHHLEEYPNEIRWDILIRMELLMPLNQYQQKYLGKTQDGMPPSAEVVQLGRELCDALAFCQRKHIVHRDVKPENIFVSEAGGFRLGDFGVAKTAASRSTGGSRKGTERYMAPEVYMNQPYGPTVDIYSLGLVMYRLLNGGRLPFLPPAPQPLGFADHENAMIRRMRGESIPPPANADGRLAEIVLKACAFQSADRWRSAGAMLQALNDYVGASFAVFSYESEIEEKSEPGTWGDDWEEERRADEGSGSGTIGGGWKEEGRGTWGEEGSGTIGGGWKEEGRGTWGEEGSGTIGGGWKEEDRGTWGEEGSGTIGGGWKEEDRRTRDVEGAGTVGGWKDNENRFRKEIQEKATERTNQKKDAMSREELVRFWKERLPGIAVQHLVRFCFFAPNIPSNLLNAAIERAQSGENPSAVLGMLSVRDKKAFGIPFWGLYVTETGITMIGTKSSKAVTNIVTAKYRQIKDVKIMKDEVTGFHKLKLLLKDDRILLFSPENFNGNPGDHYDYNALCAALLELRDSYD